MGRVIFIFDMLCTWRATTYSRLRNNSTTIRACALAMIKNKNPNWAEVPPFPRAENSPNHPKGFPHGPRSLNWIPTELYLTQNVGGFSSLIGWNSLRNLKTEFPLCLGSLSRINATLCLVKKYLLVYRVPPKTKSIITYFRNHNENWIKFLKI